MIGAASGLVILAALIAALGMALTLVSIGVRHARPRAVERIPRSALQLVVGTLPFAFGTFWALAGLGIAWPGADLAVIALAAGYVLAAAAYIGRLRRRHTWHARQLAHESAR